VNDELPLVGEVHPLARAMTGIPDPLALYRHLGAGPDTVLLESLDATTKAAERSFIVPQAAVRAECRGQRVVLEALTSGGVAALRALEAPLRTRASDLAVEPAHPSLDTPGPGRLVATYAPPPRQASEVERLAAPSPFDALRALATTWKLTSRPVAVPLLCPGVFAYDMLEVFEELPGGQDDPLDYPDFVFWLPESILALDHRRGITQVVTLVYGGEGVRRAYGEARGRIESLCRAVDEVAEATLADPPPAAPVEAAVDVDDPTFCATVLELKERIVAGDVFQIVPSRTFRAPCPDPADAYARLRRLNPSPYMFYAASPSHTLFGASPETCVKVEAAARGRRVEVRPIAGTAARGRGADGEPDLDLDGRLEAELRLDEKELAEHMMLVDLARNDVARVSVPGSRHVPRLLTVDRYSHVMHLVSYVEGTLRPELDALHAYAASMNMGTLVGAPKLKAAELLRRRERTRRGPYGGAVGYLTCDGDMDTAIVIRSATVGPDGVAHVRAGAGVVHDSRPQAEADETRRKAAAVLRALGAQ
jgi:anthranilate synthase component I